ncbi:MAG: hypothetical protein WA655_18615 [Candidatus Korobacteraceae bacterium]
MDHSGSRQQRSQVRQAACFTRQRGARICPSDRLAGVFVRFEAENEWDTLIEAAESGWWYSASVPNGAAVVAWMSDTDLTARWT